MVSKGHQAMVVCLGRHEAEEVINGVQVKRVTPVNIYNPLERSGSSGVEKLLWHTLDSFNPLTSRKVAAAIATWQPDVVHTNTLAGLSVAAWSAVKSLPSRPKIVHTLRDYYLLCPNTAMFKQGSQCERRCLECKVLGAPRALASKVVDVVVGNSQYILDKHLKEGLFADSAKHVIYNAYKPVVQQSPDTIRPITRIGYIGRIAKTKGIEVLISAFRMLQALRPNLRLVIAGVGDEAYVEDLKLHCSGLNVEFLGQVKPEVFYEGVDLVVVPSLWAEPLARVLFEAMAHGVPLVSSDTGGSPELVKDAITGFLYSPATSHEAMQSAILRFLDADVALALRIRQSQLQEAFRFLPSSVADAYEGVYLG
jgi:glycosyltransferase involved in cell wall biosynthesis